jgi:hypothetical protein
MLRKYDHQGYRIGDQQACPAEAVLELASERWKLLVIFWLLKGEHRFNQLQRNLGRITHRTLAKTMRETEADGLVNAGITVRFLRALTIGLRRSELHLPPFCRRWSDGPSETISRRQSATDGAKRGVRLNKR